jgi:hypothetical protein
VSVPKMLTQRALDQTEVMERIVYILSMPVVSDPNGSFAVESFHLRLDYHDLGRGAEPPGVTRLG